MRRRGNRPYELLIADDDPHFREALRSIFELRFSLVEAESGEEAIDIVQEQHVDLVLLDMHMEVLTGLETVRIVKSLHGLLPCIIITADATDDLRRDAEQAEAYSVLAKPVTKIEVVKSVSDAIGQTYNDPDILNWAASLN
ncbi:Transcriptional regulatory protein QseF [Symmachiella macrocystis]|uniref:Transcriptional regulatory protein QseF n=1 Tax=Symmachiella macrocystis TaxID=2527985 RepID=A0A5C6BRU5_9PLAN|nr:response regulator [Symmachiella macrocystis]TWU13609.1 Transcriptional regulatory protein QseF [Symmachiella macrocystis]